MLVPTRALAGFVLPFLGLPARRATKLALPPLEDRVGTSGARAPFDGTRPLGVAYWGHLDPGKGAHLLVDAASRLVQGGKSIRLDLHGDSVTPGYRQSLERAASDAGVDARFHGAFRITELVTDHVDVAVFPSLYHESHSFVLDEARSRGLPVVVPDRGAYPERLAEGGGGVLFRPGEAGDLARCLERFIENPLELEALRQEVKPSSPTWPEHLEALDAVYSEVMSAELEEAAWCPPRSGERLDERALAHRESLVEVLEDRVKVIPVLEREIEAHKEVGQKLQMEIAEHRESSSCLRADLDSHKKVLATKEKDLSGHRDTLREREADLHRHRAVLKERTRRVEDLEGELARAGEEIARLSDETRRVVAELEQIRGALERESEDARQKGLVVDTLERDLAGHRAVLEHLAEGLVKSTGLAEEVARVEAFPVDASGETPGEQAVRSLQQLDTLLRGIRDRSLRHRLRRLWSGRERR